MVCFARSNIAEQTFKVVGQISQAWLGIFVSWLESVNLIKTDGSQHLIFWNNILKFLMCIACKNEKI